MDERLNRWLGKDRFVVRCISSVRSIDRRTRFETFAKDIGLSFEYWDATDKSTITPTDRVMANVLVNGKVSEDATAQRISIHRCMETFLDSTDKEFLFVLQDDAGFHSNSGSRPSSISTKWSSRENLFSFVDACSLRAPSSSARTHRPCTSPFTTMDYEWMQVWFGYAEDDQDKICEISKDESVLCRCTGTSSMHAMLLRRDAVQLLVHGLVRPDARHVPIDWYVKKGMKETRTLVPRYPIIGQVDDNTLVHDETSVNVA